MNHSQWYVSIFSRMLFRKRQYERNRIRRKRSRAKNKALFQANSMMMKLFEIEDEPGISGRSLSPSEPKLSPGSKIKNRYWGFQVSDTEASTPRWPPRLSLIPKRLKTTKSLESASPEDFNSYDFVVTSEEVCF